MSFGLSAGAIIAGGAVIGGIGGALIGSNATGNAAKTQADAANNATNIQYQEWLQQQANQAPYLKAGQGALSQLSGMASTTPSFTSEDFAKNMDPAYGFDLQQGNQAIERAAAASGGLQSGGTLKSLTNYSQGQASNEYQNAYNRYMTNQNTQFNRLSSIAGIGQTATGQSAQTGATAAGQIGNNITGAANAQAGATIAQGQQWGNTLSSLGSGVPSAYAGYLQQQKMNNWMNQMLPGQPPSGSSAGFSPNGYNNMMGPTNNYAPYGE